MPKTSSKFSPRNQITTAEGSCVRGGGPSDPFEVGDSIEDSLLQNNLESEHQSYEICNTVPSHTQNMLKRLKQTPIDAGILMNGYASPMRTRLQTSIVKDVYSPHSV